MATQYGYPYITTALTRIHGVLPQGSFPNSIPETDPTWYEQIVYAENETLVKPSKEEILEEVEKIKEERGEV
jgi:hypothetical protein